MYALLLLPLVLCRYIPSRSASNLQGGFSLVDVSLGRAKDDTQLTHSLLLKSELLGADSKVLTLSPDRAPAGGGGARASGSGNGGVDAVGGSASGGSVNGNSGISGDKSGSPGAAAHLNATPRNLFRYRSSPGSKTGSDLPAANGGAGAEGLHSPSGLLIGAESQRLLTSPRRAPRKIPKVPFKVLDAPALQDDFYLNLVDWSSLNVLAVGLGSCVYLWSACTSRVTKLCDLSTDSDTITSVSWSQRGHHLAVGTNRGYVQIWDAAKCSRTHVMTGHASRVGCLAWNGQSLSSGSRDRSIFQRDIRSSNDRIAKLQGHKQEVCGLKWSFDDQLLASGGNDNRLYVWSWAATGGGNTAAALHRNSFRSNGGGAGLMGAGNGGGAGLGRTDQNSGSAVPGAGSGRVLGATGGDSAGNGGVTVCSPLMKFTDHTAAVKAIAWSPHQHGLLASGGGTADRCIRFWNTHTYK